MAGPRSGADDRQSTVGVAVEVELRGDQLELNFRRPFTLADVEVVKAIAGRRWHPQRQKWLLPHTPRTLEALQRAFGSRLHIATSPGTRAPRERASAPGTLPPSTPATAAVSADRRQAPAATNDPRQAPATAAATNAPQQVPATAAVSTDPRHVVAPAVVAGILDALRRAIRTREYSRKTEHAYESWVRRFLEFHPGYVEDPMVLTAAHAQAFLDHLAITQRLAARTRNQAASALGFLFREVLGRDDMSSVPRAKGPGRMPTVLTHREVMRVLQELRGKFFLVVVLLYSAGLRLQECLHLRTKDIDFELRQILVRDGKGRKDRYVPLARRAAELLRIQIARVAELHEKDRKAGNGWAPLPGALHRKDPTAGDALGWQFIFPASTMNRDPTTGRTGRWPLHATAVQRAVKAALRRTGITKRASCHTFRHSFATEALRGGCDIRTLQYVMGHQDIRTTMIYLHVVEQTGFCVRSPLDRPDDPADADILATAASGRPTAIEWELAARQWTPPPRSHRKREGPRSEG